MESAAPTPTMRAHEPERSNDRLFKWKKSDRKKSQHVGKQLLEAFEYFRVAGIRPFLAKTG